MRTIQIRCGKKRRLFDTIDGSRLHILIKCSNAKACPYKAACPRTTAIRLGNLRISPESIYLPVNCPQCKKRLFDVTPDSAGFVTIKCDLCGHIASIPIFSDP